MKQFLFFFLFILMVSTGNVNNNTAVGRPVASNNNSRVETKSIQPIIIGLKSSHSAMDFAGAELVKYLGMMSGNSGSATVAADPKSVHFSSDRSGTPAQIELGLLSDFGLEVDGVDDPSLDDAIYIDVRNSKGIIAGSNPRSVLFAVYRFLEASGCRWIRPGPDGDYVPSRSIDNLSVQLKDKAAYRFRGHNNSGAYSIDYIISKVEWDMKVGLNTYYDEFLVPKKFYQSWYNREYPTAKVPSPRTDKEIIAYQELLRREIKRRDMLLHAAGHGWNSLFFGNPEAECDHWGNIVVPENQTQYLSLVKGERVKGEKPTTTELCYGNHQVRLRLAKLVADYAETHPEVDYLHFWLDDKINNTCECELCRYTRVSDFYVMILNEIDKELTRRGLPTRIVFMTYSDTVWPPEKEKFQNKDRFVLMFAPISRLYDKPYEVPDKNLDLPPYRINENTLPRDIKLNIAALKAWQKVFNGPAFAYDYHMFFFHFYDQGYYAYLDILAGDIQRLSLLNLDGFVSCQMQKTFYPNGFPHYTHTRMLWNPENKVEDLAKYYFEGAFGKEGYLALDYMKTLSDLFSSKYFYRLWRTNTIASDDKDAQEARGKLLQVQDAVRRFNPVIERNLQKGAPVHQASWKYLSVHSGMVVLMADALRTRLEGKEADKKAAWNKLREYIVENEDSTEPVFDVFSFQRIFTSLQNE
jgi:hypothetical protein